MMGSQCAFRFMMMYMLYKQYALSLLTHGFRVRNLQPLPVESIDEPIV